MIFCDIVKFDVCFIIRLNSYGVALFSVLAFDCELFALLFKLRVLACFVQLSNCLCVVSCALVCVSLCVCVYNDFEVCVSDIEVCLASNILI